MAERDPHEDRESWVQTNSEFHQDWAARENQGRHVRWRAGLSLEPNAAERARRYEVQGAPRRRRRWIAWLLLFAICGGAVGWVASDRARRRTVVQKIERAIADLKRAI